MNGSPQSNFTIGNAETFLEAGGDSAKEEFNAFFTKVDEDYKTLIEKHFFGESLTFLGKKVS